MKGKDLIISAEGTALYGAKSCDINVDCETVEVASPTSAQWRDFIAGRKSWSVSCGYLVNESAIPSDVSRVGQRFQLKVYALGADADHQLKGWAICTGWKATGAVGNLAQGTFTFQGCGPLE